jgi:TolB-like protein
MRIRLRHTPVLPALAVFVVLAAVPAGVAAQEPDRRPGVAVFPFEDGGWTGMEADDRGAMSIGLQQLLLNELSRNANLRIVERNALREILAEIDLGTSGRVDANTAAQVGRLVGARYVVLGTFSDLGGSQPMLTGRVVSVETSEILEAEQVTGRKEELYRMVVQLSGDITEGVDLPALPAQERASRESRQVPPEAIRLYSRAQILQDLGRREQAIELYEQISRDFPALTEAQEALRQLKGE